MQIVYNLDGGVISHPAWDAGKGNQTFRDLWCVWSAWDQRISTCAKHVSGAEPAKRCTFDAFEHVTSAFSVRQGPRSRTSL